MMKNIFLMVVAVTVIGISSGNSMASTIRVGAANIDITPRLPVALDGQMQIRIAEKAETPLAAHVVVVESLLDKKSSSVSMFVTCDIVTIPKELTEKIQAAVGKAIPGIDTKKILINASHTHTGGVVRDGWYTLPEGVTTVKAYQAHIAERVAQAAVHAWNNREEGTVSWGMEYAKVAFNRRATYADGASQMYGKTDRNDFRGIEGYEDQSINSLFFWNLKGKLLAVCINVASPAQIVEGRSAVNADYWHPVREKLKQRFGANLTILGWIGAAGDQSPRPIYDQDADRRMLQLAIRELKPNPQDGNADFRTDAYLDAIASRIVNAVTSTYELVKNDQHKDIPFNHVVKTFDVQARIVTEKEKEDCLKNIQDIKSDPKKAITNSRQIAWNQEVVDRFNRQKVEANPQYSIESHILRIGDIVICTNPFELFTEFGIQLKARSKAQQTFVIQLVGPGTYVPTEKATEGGHYSAIVQSNLVGFEGGQQLVDKTLAFIDDVWNN